MKLVNDILEISQRIQKVRVVKAIRNGLVTIIPVLIIGAFALVFEWLPIPGYRDFVQSFAGGFIYSFFDFIHTATFGVLSIYMTFAISRAYMHTRSETNAPHFGAIITSLIVFFILSGSYIGKDYGIDKMFQLENMGVKSMIVAIIAGLGASALYTFFYGLLKRKRNHVLSMGADNDFNRMLATFLPIAIVTVSFALTNLFIVKVLNVDSFRDLYIKAFDALFSIGENGFFKGFFFVFLSSILWFFGVHGSDALQGVADTYFPSYVEGTEAILLSKDFFDVFVLMGGCGATICLLIAILISSRNRARRGLGLAAMGPMIFNINELMVFGLPIIFNPIMLIPFLLVPLLNYSVSYLALSTGIVPYISSHVEWTTPVLFGGYFATGSVGGLLLQLFNIALGIAIYLPFVKILDRESEKVIKINYDDFMSYFTQNERELQNVRLCDLGNIYGSFAKELSADIRHDLMKNLKMYYQPQFNYKGECIGVEALLRWKHPVLGIIYPPLVMKLTNEINLSAKLEEAITYQVLKDRDALLAKYGPDIKISINATGSSFSGGELLTWLREINASTPFKGKNICIELTEQEAFSINDKTRSILKELKEMGLFLSIDDFSMGQTTLHYLRENLFDEIKIDGSLTKGLTSSSNVREIVSSLIELANSLSLNVIAEYVENEEERDILHEMGCDEYQGYFYSPAVPLDESSQKETN